MWLNELSQRFPTLLQELRWIGPLVVLCLISIGGCKAKPPGKFETAVLTRAKHKLTVGNAKEKNPLPSDSDNIAAGQEAFSNFCDACHGLDGQSTGVPFADRMSPPVPSLASKEVQSYSDGQLKWIIDNGLSPSGMPGSKGVLTDEEIWSIVIYIRHLPPAGSLGDPPKYSGDDPPTCVSQADQKPTRRSHER
jgi:S-disulfanyl-L-cysteine oxidoreductase SoxD